MGSFLELVTQHAAGGVCGSPARYVTCLLNDNDNLITVFAVPVFAVPVQNEFSWAVVRLVYLEARCFEFFFFLVLNCEVL